MNWTKLFYLSWDEVYFFASSNRLIIYHWYQWYWQKLIYLQCSMLFCIGHFMLQNSWFNSITTTTLRWVSRCACGIRSWSYFRITGVSISIQRYFTAHNKQIILNIKKSNKFRSSMELHSSLEKGYFRSRCYCRWVSQPIKVANKNELIRCEWTINIPSPPSTLFVHEIFFFFSLVLRFNNKSKKSKAFTCRPPTHIINDFYLLIYN